MPASDPIVVSDIVKRFDHVTALDHVTLSVEKGETFGLIGPNGSGKTTLIRLLLGLGAPTEGSITVLGRKMPNRQVAPHIGYMTQSSALYNELSIRENLAFFGTLYGLRGKRLKARIAATLELVDLAERADSPIQTLSGGMRQRVSLGCALIHEPELIFLDEPTVGIDPELRVDVLGLLCATQPARRDTHRLDAQPGRGDPLPPTGAAALWQAARRRYPGLDSAAVRQKRLRAGIPLLRAARRACEPEPACETMQRRRHNRCHSSV